jgi:hypothetical protein
VRRLRVEALDDWVAPAAFEVTSLLDEGRAGTPRAPVTSSWWIGPDASRTTCFSES